MTDDLRITVPELWNAVEQGQRFVFIDTRNPTAWSESDEKLPDALRIPLSEWEEHLSEISRDKPIVAYCT